MPGARVAVLGAPDGFLASVPSWPSNVRVLRATRKPLDVAVLFVTRRSELLRRFPTTQRAMTPGGSLWVAWPRRSSGVVTDLHDREVREIGLAHGLVDNKVVALDESWSGLRFVARVAPQ